MNDLVTTPQLKVQELKVYTLSVYDIINNLNAHIKLSGIKKKDVYKNLQDDSYTGEWIVLDVKQMSKLFFREYMMKYSTTKELYDIIRDNVMCKNFRYTFEYQVGAYRTYKPYKTTDYFQKFIHNDSEIHEIKIGYNTTVKVYLPYIIIKESFLSFLTQSYHNYLIINKEHIRGYENNVKKPGYKLDKLITHSDIMREKLISILSYMIKNINNGENTVDMEEYLDQWVHRLLHND